MAKSYKEYTLVGKGLQDVSTFADAEVAGVRMKAGDVVVGVWHTTGGAETTVRKFFATQVGGTIPTLAVHTPKPLGVVADARESVSYGVFEMEAD